MSDADPRRDQIAAVLIEHTRTSTEDCHCGWVDATALGQSHPYHVSEQLQPIIDEAVDDARAEAWDEGEADGRHNEHEYRPGKQITNPYREHGTRP